jgi:hypothetical protein
LLEHVSGRIGTGNTVGLNLSNGRKNGIFDFSRLLQDKSRNCFEYRIEHVEFHLEHMKVVLEHVPGRIGPKTDRI